MYLRKSQMDSDYETASVEDTLKRHKKILTDFAKANKLHVAVILEEPKNLLHDPFKTYTCS